MIMQPQLIAQNAATGNASANVNNGAAVNFANPYQGFPMMP
jgi:hypothetical protein